MNHRMRAMTARRLDKAVMRCVPMTQEQAWAKLQSNFPMNDQQVACNDLADMQRRKAGR